MCEEYFAKTICHVFCHGHEKLQDLKLNQRYNKEKKSQEM
jgi:hypothetical protein